MMRFVLLAMGMLMGCGGSLIDGGEYDTSVHYLRDDWPESRVGTTRQATWRIGHLGGDRYWLTVVETDTELEGRSEGGVIVFDESLRGGPRCDDELFVHIAIEPTGEGHSFTGDGRLVLPLCDSGALVSESRLEGVRAR